MYLHFTDESVSPASSPKTFEEEEETSVGCLRDYHVYKLNSVNAFLVVADSKCSVSGTEVDQRSYNKYINTTLIY